jgi:hypothetical protein
MTTISHEPSRVDPQRKPWWAQLLVPELWASLAIVAMWLAVLFDGIYGPDFVSSSGASTTTIPSVIVLVPFAFLGTRAVARSGFRHEQDD